MHMVYMNVGTLPHVKNMHVSLLTVAQRIRKKCVCMGLHLYEVNFYCFM